MQESDAHTGSETVSYAYENFHEPIYQSKFEITAPLKSNAATIQFEHQGKTARIHVIDGSVEYEGDLPVGESARLLFEAFAQIGFRP